MPPWEERMGARLLLPDETAPESGPPTCAGPGPATGARSSVGPPTRTEVISMADKQKDWTVRIHITEDGDDTRAEAVLTTEDATEDASPVTGRGVAHRNPIDRPIPEIGDELAASRALEDLAIRLHDIASDDIVELAGPADQGGSRAWERP